MQNMKILIYGMGGMGKFFHEFFKSRGYWVKGYDRIQERSEIDEGEISGFDVIFLCVPMDEIEKALNNIAKKTKRALIVDISSLKSFSIPYLKRSGVDFLSIHPMFGPDSEIALSNVIVVWESGREEEKAILHELKRSGAVLTKMDYEEHDRKMAEVQGIAHFLLFLFALSIKDKFTQNHLKIASPIFITLYRLASRIINQDWRLYFNIQSNAEGLRKKVIESAYLLDRILRDEREFEKLLKEMREVFREEGSALLLDASKATMEVEGLEMLRGYIRNIDSLILRLIEKRVSAGQKVALEKLKLNQPVEISQVEDFKLREIVGKTSLNPIIISQIFERLMNITKEEEYKILGIKKKIAVLGPPGSFSEEIALRLTGSRLPFIYRNSIEDVFSSVVNGEAEYGIVPIENSIHGTVLSTLDSLLRYDVEVFAEYEAEIRHNLVAKRDLSMKEIEIVYSHPQAIAQCGEFLNNYLPHAEIRYTRTTSEAIELLDDRSAAIASELAARLYKLHIIKKDIQSLASNVTRFYIIRRAGRLAESQGDLTCMFFGVDDKPGALYKVLEVFYEKQINLRKLESRPAGTKLGDYIFFVEAERRLDPDTVSQIEKRTTFCKVAGFFKRIEKLDVFSE